MIDSFPNELYTPIKTNLGQHVGGMSAAFPPKHELGDTYILQWNRIGSCDDTSICRRKNEYIQPRFPLT